MCYVADYEWESGVWDARDVEWAGADAECGGQGGGAVVEWGVVHAEYDGEEGGVFGVGCVWGGGGGGGGVEFCEC